MNIDINFGITEILNIDINLGIKNININIDI